MQTYWIKQATKCNNTLNERIEKEQTLESYESKFSVNCGLVRTTQLLNARTRKAIYIQSHKRCKVLHSQGVARVITTVHRAERQLLCVLRRFSFSEFHWLAAVQSGNLFSFCSTVLLYFLVLFCYFVFFVFFVCGLDSFVRIISWTLWEDYSIMLNFLVCFFLNTHVLIWAA